ncbi:hypothetical protein OGAPHI_003253 [Ogataea philodendri]|uniref:Uncharacterized protein n=1 Tax=Ogataea philodendri TaxID=1378263 RepID=A0A9P8P8B4_9ASCO|nr:uncharacterized protein OGAPHI_003253 [Ogataea philodendri]KAH3666804.1 hypothetical protein OGAPHI_003253 [Ogataea philodendri]
MYDGYASVKSVSTTFAVPVEVSFKCKSRTCSLRSISCPTRVSSTGSRSRRVSLSLQLLAMFTRNLKVEKLGAICWLCIHSMLAKTVESQHRLAKLTLSLMVVPSETLNE